MAVCYKYTVREASPRAKISPADKVLQTAAKAVRKAGFYVEDLPDGISIHYDQFHGMVNLSRDPSGIVFKFREDEESRGVANKILETFKKSVDFNLLIVSLRRYKTRETFKSF